MSIGKVTDSSTGSRLRDERQRLGWTQAAAAATVGVARETWSRYESGLLTPGLEVLAALARNGMDVVFLLIGERVDVTNASLTDEQRALLESYAVCGPGDKAALRQLADSAARANGKLKNPE